MKDATELAVGVSSAGFEFYRGRRRYLLRIARVQLDPTEFEPVDEQPYPVPAHWLDAPVQQKFADFLYRVGPPRTPSTPIRSKAGCTAVALALPVMIDTTPPPAAHRHSWSTRGFGCSM